MATLGLIVFFLAYLYYVQLFFTLLYNIYKYIYICMYIIYTHIFLKVV